MVHARRLDEGDAMTLARDARIVAVRWDLLPWHVVLDLDTPIAEGKGAAMRRAWLVFNGISEVDIPIRMARLPTGIWLTSEFSVELESDGFSLYTCSAMLPVFDGNFPPADPVRVISVRARGLVGTVSISADIPAESGLSWEARTALASDEQMLAVVSSSTP